MYRKSSPETDK